MATELMVSSKHASTCDSGNSHEFLSTNENPGCAGKQRLDGIVVSWLSGLPPRLSPVCVVVLLTACHTGYVPFWAVAQFPSPIPGRGPASFWLPGHPSGCSLPFKEVPLKMRWSFRFISVSLAEVLLKLTSRGRIIFHLSLFDFFVLVLPPSHPQL